MIGTKNKQPPNLAEVYAAAEQSRLMADVARQNAVAERAARREDAAADLLAQRENAAIKREARRERRDARRTDRSAAWSRAGRRVAVLARLGVPLAPLCAVNTLAVVGQVGFAHDRIIGGWPVAILFAVVLESIALFLGYHADKALRRGDSAAGKQIAAYAIAGVVAGINYAHYAGAAGAPTATAVAFGLVSLLSPWLWRVHSHATHRDTLHKAGQIDVRAVRLSASRKLWHPIKSLKVMRWAAWEGAETPHDAITGWTAAEHAKAALKAAEKAARVDQRPSTPRARRGWFTRTTAEKQGETEQPAALSAGQGDTPALPAVPTDRPSVLPAAPVSVTTVARTGRRGQVRAGRSSRTGQTPVPMTVESLVTTLDKLGVARNAGRSTCRSALKAEGLSAGTDVLAAAIRARRASTATQVDPLGERGERVIYESGDAFMAHMDEPLGTDKQSSDVTESAGENASEEVR